MKTYKNSMKHRAIYEKLWKQKTCKTHDKLVKHGKNMETWKTH